MSQTALQLAKLILLGLLLELLSESIQSSCNLRARLGRLLACDAFNQLPEIFKYQTGILLVGRNIAPKIYVLVTWGILQLLVFDLDYLSDRRESFDFTQQACDFIVDFGCAGLQIF